MSYEGVQFSSHRSNPTVGRLEIAFEAPDVFAPTLRSGWCRRRRQPAEGEPQLCVCYRVYKSRALGFHAFGLWSPVHEGFGSRHEPLERGYCVVVVRFPFHCVAPGARNS